MPVEHTGFPLRPPVLTCSSGWTRPPSCSSTPMASPACPPTRRCCSGISTRRRWPDATSTTTSAIATASRCATSSKRWCCTTRRCRPTWPREVWRYTKLFWINSGGYNNLTARKFVLKLSPDALVAAADSRGGERRHVPPACRASRPATWPSGWRRSSSTPSVDPMVTNKTPGADGDMLRDSANNLYSGVSMADLDGFVERYPLTSRLVKRDGRLDEEVYRIGGLYGDYLQRIVRSPASRDSLRQPGVRRAPSPRSSSGIAPAKKRIARPSTWRGCRPPIRRSTR